MLARLCRHERLIIFDLIPSEDPSDIVRRAAVSSLSHVCLAADSSASLLVLRRVVDIDAEVRRAALTTARQLYQLAGSEHRANGFAQIVQAALARLRQDEVAEVRLAAVDTLHVLAADERVDRRLVGELVQVAGTKEQPPCVRERCLEVLTPETSAQSAGTTQANRILHESLASQLPVMADILHTILRREKELKLRVAASQYMDHFSHPTFQSAAEAGLVDADLHVQSLCMSAVLKMGKVSEKSRRVCAAWALKGLKHPTREMRMDAAGKLALLGRTDDARLDKQILEALLARLEDVPDVAAAVLDALAACASQGDLAVIRCLSQMFSSVDSKVRCAAARALGKVAKAGDEVALAALRTGLLPPFHAEVVSAAVQALGTVSRRGDPPVIGLLVDLLPQVGHDELREALLVLARLTLRRGSGIVTASILRILEQSTAIPLRIQLACVQALQAVARKGDPRFVECLLSLLRSGNSQLCETAVVALAEHGKRGDATIICSLLPLVSGTGAVQDEVRLRISAIRAIALLASSRMDGSKKKQSDATAIAAIADCLKDSADARTLFSLHLSSFLD